MKSNNSFANLFFGSSQEESDIFYLGKIAIGDPFLVIQLLADKTSSSFKNKTIAVVNSLEFDRCKKESSFDEILLFSNIVDTIKVANDEKNIGLVDIIAHLSNLYGIECFLLSRNFPVWLAEKMRNSKIKFEIRESLFLNDRLIKTQKEIEHLKNASKIAQKGMKVAMNILKKATVQNGKLFLKNKILTSEYVISMIEKTCFNAGGLACNTIVACGKQACQPHSRGTGQLYANELIVVDIFPKDRNSGYFGDMSRTFLKGNPTQDQRKLINTVMNAQKKAIESVKPGVFAKDIHIIVDKYFEENGYFSSLKGEKIEGFIHSTGHGIGLDVHESPNISLRSEHRLEKNMVFTIEPGLYYESVGGVRIEDVICVGKDKPILLSKFSYEWIIE